MQQDLKVHTSENVLEVIPGSRAEQDAKTNYNSRDFETKCPCKHLKKYMVLLNITIFAFLDIYVINVEVKI